MKVFFATPAYDGTCHVAMVRSLIGERDLLREAGIEAEWRDHAGCCYLPITRNALVQMFLESDATDLIFIDSDIEWELGASWKLLKHIDKEVVAGAYRHKVDAESYPALCNGDADGRPVVDPATGLIRAMLVPTGFLKIRRSAFEKFRAHYGSREVIDRSDPNNPKPYYCYFDTVRIGEQWWGEDLHFCNEWRAMGGEIWVEPDITISHHGLRRFEGNFHLYLRAAPGGGGPAPKEWTHEPRA